MFPLPNNCRKRWRKNSIFEWSKNVFLSSVRFRHITMFISKWDGPLFESHTFQEHGGRFCIELRYDPLLDSVFNEVLSVGWRCFRFYQLFKQLTRTEHFLGLEKGSFLRGKGRPLKMKSQNKVFIFIKARKISALQSSSKTCKITGDFFTVKLKRGFTFQSLGNTFFGNSVSSLSLKGQGH